MSRKLASLRIISSIDPIPGADAIEVVTVDGWEIVSQKGIHQEGDMIVYCEIDSLLPELPEFEFLRDRCYVKNSVEGAGFRLKTIKLRGQLSQGLIVPLKAVSYYLTRTIDPVDFVDGLDVTEALGIKKFERPPSGAVLSGSARGNFPTFIPKTDEERVQNRMKYITGKWSGFKWEASMKLDGSSMTVYNRIVEDGEVEFGVCSRNLDLTETEGNTFWAVANRHGLRDKLRHHNYAIQGELMGPGIQGNRENLTEHELYVFNIFDIARQRKLGPVERSTFCRFWGLQEAPIVSAEHYIGDECTVKDLLEFAEGPSIKHPIREGLVFKAYNDPDISFKVISNKFLLKGGE